MFDEYVLSWQKNCTLIESKLASDKDRLVVSKMPSNDDIKQPSDETTNGQMSGRASDASVLNNDHVSGANDESAELLSSNNSQPQEFTFFQKKKRTNQVVSAPSVAYSSASQITAFAARLDIAIAVNAKTQRHIAELMTLMSDVASTMTLDASEPTRIKSRRSKWFFYGSLMGCGVGWFLLFPSGNKFVSELAAFLAR